MEMQSDKLKHTHKIIDGLKSYRWFAQIVMNRHQTDWHSDFQNHHRRQTRWTTYWCHGGTCNSFHFYIFLAQKSDKLVVVAHFRFHFHSRERNYNWHDCILAEKRRNGKELDHDGTSFLRILIFLRVCYPQINRYTTCILWKNWLIQ